MTERGAMGDEVRELLTQGREHFQRGNYSIAAGQLEQVVARGHAFPDVHHMLGCIYHHLGEFESAQKAFARALELNPAYVEAALNLAIVCNDMGQYARAQQVYGAALEQVKSGRSGAAGQAPLDRYTQGKLANLHGALGDAYASVQRPLDAAGEYRRALALSPGFVDLRLKLANALREAGSLEEALEEHRRAVRDAPAYVPARVALGIALYASGKVDEAVGQWREVVALDPRHRTAALYLKLAGDQAGQGGAGHRERR